MTLPELIPEAVPLTKAPGLSDAQRRALAGLWIGSAQELVSIYGTSETARRLLANALGIPRPALDPLVNAAQRLIPLTRDLTSAALELETLATQYELGAVLEEAAGERAATLPPYVGESRGALPESVSLLDRLPPLRGQGRRATCVAHAALAVRECLEIAAGAPGNFDLSEQYVYWWCKERDGLAGRSGSYLSLGMKCLEFVGPPLEALWPYRDTPTSDEGQGPPPISAAGGDPAFRTLETLEFNRGDIQGMKTCLSEGRPIAFSLPVYDSWFKSSTMKRWGKITLPLPGESPREGHALTLVGYQDDPAAPGGGYFLVRNSWQPWAWDSVWAKGYGYIPYGYLSRHASVIYSARRLMGASAGVREGAQEAGYIRNSPDVWLRQAADAGGEPQAPKPGQENAIYARIFNAGPACAYRVSVEIACAPAMSGTPAAPEPVGRLEVAMAWPGETVLGPLPWTPPGPGPFDFLARVSATG